MKLTSTLIRKMRRALRDGLQLKTAPATERQRKAYAAGETKADDQGHVIAVFATFNVKDLDGDVTLPGAFEDGAEVLISAYNHGTWNDALPAGKGTIHSDDSKAWLDGQFFLDTQAGRETFTTVKNTGSLQQWSYGFQVLETAEVTDAMYQQGVSRVLKKLKVWEVAPVMVAAGIGTRTLLVKSAVDLKELVEIRNAQSRRDREQLVREEPKRRDVPVETRVAAEYAAKLGARILGADAAPRVRFMTTERGKAAKALGLTFTFRRCELWVRQDLGAKEAFITAAHEAAHVLRPDWSEADVERFAVTLEQVYAKDAVVLVGDPERTPPPSEPAFLVHDLRVFEAVAAADAPVHAKRWRVPSIAERDRPSAYLSPEYVGPARVELAWHEVLSLI